MKGNFSETSFEEILTVVGKEHRSGILYVYNRSANISIHFKSGLIVAVYSTGVKRFIGAMLVQAAFITRTELKKALVDQKQTYKRIGSILEAEGKLTKTDLRQFIFFQAWDLLISVFFMPLASFEFVKEKQNIEKETSLNIDPVEVISRGREIVDEFKNIEASISSYRLIYRKAVGYERALEQKEKSLSEDEKKVLSLVNGQRSVKDLFVSSMLGEFRTIKALHVLISKGLIKQSKFLIFFDRRQRFIPNDESLIHINIEKMPVILFNMVVVFSIFLIIYFSQPGFGDVFKGLVKNEQGVQKVKEFLSDYQKDKIKFILLVYYLSEGQFPESLADLTQGKYRVLKKVDLKYPWDTEYFYQKKKHGYVLLTPR